MKELAAAGNHTGAINQRAEAMSEDWLLEPPLKSMPPSRQLEPPHCSQRARTWPPSPGLRMLSQGRLLRQRCSNWSVQRITQDLHKLAQPESRPPLSLCPRENWLDACAMGLRNVKSSSSSNLPETLFSPMERRTLDDTPRWSCLQRPHCFLSCGRCTYHQLHGPSTDKKVFQEISSW